MNKIGDPQGLLLGSMNPAFNNFWTCFSTCSSFFFVFSKGALWRGGMFTGLLSRLIGR